jgi:hypothetical protein
LLARFAEEEMKVRNRGRLEASSHQPAAALKKLRHTLFQHDLTSLSTLVGQNTAPPSEKPFGRHFIVKAPSSISVGGPYRDPSYGVIYSSACDFEAKAVAGYAAEQAPLHQWSVSRFDNHHLAVATSL